MNRHYGDKEVAFLMKHGLDAQLPPVKRRRNLEGEMQRALIRWWASAHAGFGLPECVLFSIPNGGGRSGARLGSILKAEGLRPGAPDLCLAVPRLRTNASGCGSIAQVAVTGHSALFLELKTETGRVSIEQHTMHIELRKQGYRVEVVRSFEAATNIIKEYLT